MSGEEARLQLSAHELAVLSTIREAAASALESGAARLDVTQRSHDVWTTTDRSGDL